MSTTGLGTDYLGDNVVILDSMEWDGMLFEVLEYTELLGSSDPSISQHLYFSQKTGLRLRQVRITMTRPNNEVVVEAGALQYLKGRIKSENKVGGFGGMAKKMFGNKINKEEMFRPSYTGVGEIYLEPSFSNFLLVSLDDPTDRLVMDKGMYYCSTGKMDVGVSRVKTFSSAFLGSDGFFQTSVKGRGIVAVEIPVPMSEMRMVELNNEMLQVDGTFAVMHEGDIHMTVGLASKGIIRTLFSGDGLVEKFEGTGRVWLAPTRDTYVGISEQAKAVVTKKNMENSNGISLNDYME